MNYLNPSSSASPFTHAGYPPPLPSDSSSAPGDAIARLNGFPSSTTAPPPPPLKGGVYPPPDGVPEATSRPPPAQPTPRPLSLKSLWQSQPPPRLAANASASAATLGTMLSSTGPDRTSTLLRGRPGPLEAPPQQPPSLAAPLCSEGARGSKGGKYGVTQEGVRANSWAKWWGFFQQLDPYEHFTAPTSPYSSFFQSRLSRSPVNVSLPLKENDGAGLPGGGRLFDFSAARFLSSMAEAFHLWRQDQQQHHFRGAEGTLPPLAAIETVYLESLRLERLVTQAVLWRTLIEWSCWVLPLACERKEKEEEGQVHHTAVPHSHDSVDGSVSEPELCMANLEEMVAYTDLWVRTAFPKASALADRETLTPTPRQASLSGSFSFIVKRLVHLYMVDRLWEIAVFEDTSALSFTEVPQQKRQGRRPKHPPPTPSEPSRAVNADERSANATIAPSPFCLPVSERVARHYYACIPSPMSLADLYAMAHTGVRCARVVPEDEQIIVPSGRGRGRRSRAAATMPHPPSAGRHPDEQEQPYTFTTVSLQELRDGFDLLVRNSALYNGDGTWMAEAAKQVQHASIKWWRHVSTVWDICVVELKTLPWSSVNGAALVSTDLEARRLSEGLQRVVVAVYRLWDDTELHRGESPIGMRRGAEVYYSALSAALHLPASFEQRVAQIEPHSRTISSLGYTGTKGLLPPLPHGALPVSLSWLWYPLPPVPAVQMGSLLAVPSVKREEKANAGPSFEVRHDESGRPVYRLGKLFAGAPPRRPTPVSPRIPNPDTDDDQPPYSESSPQEIFWIRCGACARWRIVPEELNPVPPYWCCADAGRRCSQRGTEKQLRKREKAQRAERPLKPQPPEGERHHETDGEPPRRRRGRPRLQPHAVPDGSEVGKETSRWAEDTPLADRFEVVRPRRGRPPRVTHPTRDGVKTRTTHSAPPVRPPHQSGALLDSVSSSDVTSPPSSETSHSDSSGTSSRHRKRKTRNTKKSLLKSKRRRREQHAKQRKLRRRRREKENASTRRSSSTSSSSDSSSETSSRDSSASRVRVSPAELQRLETEVTQLEAEEWDGMSKDMAIHKAFMLLQKIDALDKKLLQLSGEKPASHKKK